LEKDSYETCPVCDSSLPEEDVECPNCGAVLELFDIDVSIDNGVSEEAIEKVRSLILEEEEDEELLEKFREMEFSAIVTEIEEGEEIEEVVTFACPICDSEVGENDSKCPNCGAIFEEERDEEDLEDEEDQKESTTVDFQDEIDRYQKRISRFENLGLDMQYLKEDVSELKKAQSTGDEKKCERISDEIQDRIEHVENIIEIIAKCENFLSVLSEKIDVSEMEKKVDKIYEGCKIGEYRVAAKRGENIQNEIVGELSGVDEGKWLDDLIENRSEEARELISNIKADVDIERVEEKIDEALSARNDGNVEEGVHKVMEALDSASKISEISEKIEEANKYLENIKQIGIDTSEYLESIDDTIRKIGTGEKETAFEIIEETMADMQNKLEKDKKEKAEKQDSKEPSEKIQKKINSMESLLEEAEKFDIEICEGEEKVEEAVRYAEENEYEEGFMKLEEVENMYRGKLEKEIDEIVDSMKEEGGTKTYLMKNFLLDEVEKLKENGNYKIILDIIEETENISKIENIISYSEDLEFEMNDVKALLSEAKEKIEIRDWSGCRNYVESCRKKVKNKLLDFLKGEIKYAKKKLSVVDSEDIDITKPIDFLKEANRSRKDNQLEESFKALKNYKEEMEKIFENT